MKKIFLKVMAVIILATGFSKEAKAISDAEMYDLIGGGAGLGVIGIIIAAVVYKSKSKANQAINKLESSTQSKIEKFNYSAADREEAFAKLHSMTINLRASTSSLSSNLSEPEAQEFAGQVAQVVSDSTGQSLPKIISDLQSTTQYQALPKEQRRSLDLSSFVAKQKEAQAQIKRNIQRNLETITEVTRMDPLVVRYGSNDYRIRLNAAKSELSSNQRQLKSLQQQHSQELQNKFGVKPEELIHYPHLQPEIS